jgi:transcriptional regulator with XRE-family HTH domain
VTVAKRFSQNLVRLRKAADLSQEELAVMACIHRTEISQLERGLRTPRIDTLVKLAGSLQVRVEDLLEGIHWTPGTIHLGSFADP